MKNLTDAMRDLAGEHMAPFRREVIRFRYLNYHLSGWAHEKLLNGLNSDGVLGQPVDDQLGEDVKALRDAKNTTRP